MGKNFREAPNTQFSKTALRTQRSIPVQQQLSSAAKKGVPDPDANPVLRSIVRKSQTRQCAEPRD